MPVLSGDIKRRDYTVHRFSAAEATLNIEFALDHDGAATRWARIAKRGDVVDTGAPLTSDMVTRRFD